MTKEPATLPPGQPHKSVGELAAELGFSHSAFPNWRRRFPDAPKTLIADEWREFLKRNGLGTRAGSASGRPANVSQQEAQLRKTLSDARLNEIKIAKEERKLIPADQVESFLHYAAARACSSVYQMVAEASPMCAGLEVEEIRRILRDKADVICKNTQTVVEDWQAEQEEARKAAEQAAAEQSQ